MNTNKTLQRRTLLAAFAAVGVGAVSSTESVLADEDVQKVLTEQNDDLLPDYANRVGRVMIEGLNEAFDDWNDGDITISELDAVIDAWAEGDRVFDVHIIELDSDINQDTVLEKDPDDVTTDLPIVYQVQSFIDINARLEIEAGVAIEFQQGTGFDVDDGTLVGLGTQDENILMTGTRGQRGWWNGLGIGSDDLDNVIEHMTVEYGGRGGNACLSVDSALIEVSNCTFRRSGGYGLWLSSSGELAGGSGQNTYTKSRLGAAFVRTDNMHTLSGDSTFQDNDEDRDFVRVSSRDLEGDGPDESTTTWDAIDVPYRMTGGRHDIDDIELIIEEGATFEFTQDSYPRLRSGSRLTFEGTEADPITFTGTDKQRGWWDGIEFETSDGENVFKHVTVEYGGNDLDGNIVFADRLSSHTAYLQMEHCTLRQSGRYGMYLDDGVELDTVENTYTGNESGAARLPTESMHMLSDTSTFQGNDDDYVLVAPNTIEGDGAGETQITWDAIDVPYRMQSSRHDIDELELVIDPGATFEFTEGARMRIRSGTRMNFNGFDDEEENEEDLIKEITFTGVQKERGWWDGLEIETPDSANLMRYVVVEYAGNDLPGNITLADRLSSHKVTLELSNCTFRQSDGYGMYLDDGVELDTNGNTYTENAAGAAYIQTENIHMLTRRSTFQGNDNDYVFVEDSTLNDSWGDEVTWDGIDVPYRMDDRHDVDDLELTIDFGATFEFTGASRIRFRSDCTVITEGSEDFPVTFTGTDEIPGWWDGIEFETDSLLNSMEHTIVEYGGNDLPANITFADRLSGHNGYADMHHCTIRNSGGYGMYLDDGVELELSDNTYTGNEDSPVYLPAENGHELSASSDFTGNDNDTIEVEGSTVTTSNTSEEPTWEGINVPYRITGDVEFDDVTLTVASGTEIHFEQDYELEFDTDSGLRLEGTENDPISITATEAGQGLQGWWRGIYIKSIDIQNSMEHVVVGNGGRDPNSTPEGNVHVDGDGAVQMSDSILRDSDGAGVYVESGASVNGDICDVNEFENNNGGDCIVN